ncbi:MAG TPA: hypothetical protein VM165_17330 [Planctomycetaceae bacterium]|nr:hypothetical protein [Planctomycetaceae bacterium]
MSTSLIDDRKTDESREIEALLKPHFAYVNCYRYNSAIVRLCVVDEQFRPMSQVQRHERIEPFLQQLSPDIQDELIYILLLAPGEAHDVRYSQRYLEFMDPSPSILETLN